MIRGLILSLILFASAPVGAQMMVIHNMQPSTVGGGGGGLSVETVGATISSGVVTSSSQVFTCGGSTDLLLVAISLRRNSGQDPSHVTWSDGATTYPLTLSTRTVSGQQFRNYIYYLSNPASGTGNIVVTYSAATTGVGVGSISFTGTASAPINPGIHATQSVTTSSATATTTSGDILVSLMVKQDSSTSEPELNTAGATLQTDLDYSSGGNGGHYKLTTIVADGGSKTINYSWTTAANHAHAWVVITP